MSGDCRAFRERLIAALEPRRRGTGAPELAELNWHEHLLGCAACREVLAAEEALELLLDSLPEPKLPRELAVRVLARLRRGGLDELLERADAVFDEPALVRRVLAGLAAERADAALDRLLERVPPADVPADLAARTLARLALARRPAAARAAARRWLAAAAAAAIVLVGAWSWFAWRRAASVQESDPIAGEERAGALDAPSDELLASLPVLESWELLNSEDLDVWLSSLDARDELLLELATELASEDEGEAGDGARGGADAVAPGEQRNG